MADWGQPTLDSLKVDVLDGLKLRDIDSITLAEGPTNPPVGAKRWNHTAKTFQEWSGTAWTDLVISLAGGGTGTGTGQAFGTMAYQNSNNVAISGGTITGLSNLTISGNAHFNGLMYAGPSNAVQLTNSAGNIREEAIADGTILARVAANEAITGVWTFQHSAPAIWFKEIDAGVNLKNWRFLAEGTNFFLQGMVDDGSSGATYLEVSRIGPVTINMYTDVGISGKLNVNGKSTLVGGAIVTAGGNASIVSAPGAIQIAAGLGAPVSGKICFGDGTGWHLQFCSVDAAGDTQTKISFTDQGIIQTAGNIAIAPAGTMGTRLTIAGNSTSAAPIGLTSGEPGMNANWVTLGNNWSNNARFNTTIGGAFVRLRDGGISLHTVNTAGVVRSGIDFRENEVTTFGYQYYLYDINGAEFQGRIYGETPGAKLTVTGNVWATFACADGAQGIQCRNNQFVHIFNSNLTPVSDGGLYLGHSSYRWNQIWSTIGTISTSDERGKNRLGKIENALDIVKALKPGIFSFDAMTLNTGEEVPEIIFPGFTAQDVDSVLDRKLKTNIVRKNREDMWGMNYDHLIPVLWKAVQEIAEILRNDTKQN